VTVALIIWLVVSAIVAGLIAPQKPNTGFPDSAAVLAFISLVAVSIERGIEGFFAVMAGPFGQWWPLNVVRDEFDRFEQQTNGLLTGVVAETLEGLKAAKEAAAGDAMAVAAIQVAIDDVVREQNGKRLVADKILCLVDSVAEAQGLFLACIADVSNVRDRPDLLEEIVFAAFLE